MPRLVAPTTSVHRSFLAAMAELQAEGRGAPDDSTMIGWELRTFGATWHEPAGFARYVAALHAQADAAAARPLHWVPCTTLWYIDGNTYLGRLAIRHRLNEELLQRGGHIGYDVRPSARRRGHATTMLGASLPIARRLGIERALVTCDVVNVASRKVIEANGGVLEDERHGKLRFWIDCSLPDR